MHDPSQCNDFPDFDLPIQLPMEPNHDARIASAIAEIGDKTAPNYAHYARKHKVDRSTLSRRHRGKTTSRKEASSKHRQNLTIAQEQLLLAHTNRLTDQNLPPTAKIV